jgi:hypothetical protein
MAAASIMDVGGQLVHIAPELILIVRRIEFCEANIKIEIIFGLDRSDGFKRLVKKTQCFWEFVGFAAEQCLSHAFPGIHGDLLRIWYLVGLGKILNLDSVVHFAIPALIWPQKGAKNIKIKFQACKFNVLQ